ncbi:MAG: TetR family transcriptional regulator [Rhodospirillaceae bacterium]
MARKAKKPGTRKPAADPRDRLIDAAMTLAAETGWRGLSMRAVADAAGMPLADALGVFADKGRLLRGFTRRIDAAVLAGGGAVDPADTPRDRLFEVLMRRFDELAPYKPAVRRIARDLGRDPLALFCHADRLAGAMALMLECAVIDSNGISGRLRVKGLALVYGVAIRAWLADDSPDQAATMAALDRALMRAERAAGLLWPAAQATPAD